MMAMATTIMDLLMATAMENEIAIAVYNSKNHFVAYHLDISLSYNEIHAKHSPVFNLFRFDVYALLHLFE